MPSGGGVRVRVRVRAESQSISFVSGKLFSCRVSDQKLMLGAH